MRAHKFYETVSTHKKHSFRKGNTSALPKLTTKTNRLRKNEQHNPSTYDNAKSNKKLQTLGSFGVRNDIHSKINDLKNQKVSELDLLYDVKQSDNREGFLTKPCCSSHLRKLSLSRRPRAEFQSIELSINGKLMSPRHKYEASMKKKQRKLRQLTGFYAFRKQLKPQKSEIGPWTFQN